MEQNEITKLELEPCFELEDFMNFGKETRLDGQTLTELARLWEQWLELLSAKVLRDGQLSWLAIWLPEAVEQAVDEAWRESPGKGYLLNTLAQYLCMAAVQDVLPQAADGGCAPAPRPSAALQALLVRAEMNVSPESATPERRYAVVTNYPFKGGCEICALRQRCPKANGMGDFTTITLPGHERAPGN